MWWLPLSCRTSADVAEDISTVDVTVCAWSLVDDTLCVLYVQPKTVQLLTTKSTLDDVWTAQMISFIHHAQSTLKFAKKIPG